MSLSRILLAGNLKRIAIIGMAKNVGKTTTLNYLQDELWDQRLGLISLGRDGEPQDLVTFRRKPAIKVKVGTLVATAAKMGEEASALLKPLVTTSISTPFGPVVLYQVEGRGKVILTGSRTGDHLKELLGLMQERCDLILMDGALNRRRTATPLLSDGTILATGASLSSSLETVIKKSADAIKILKTPPLPPGRLTLILEEYKGEQGLLFLYSSLHRDFFARPVLSINEDLYQQHIRDDLEAIYLSGALTPKNLKAITKSMSGKKDLNLIVPDATHLFLCPLDLAPFYQRGGHLFVLQKINLLALTINPTSPIGPSFSATDFFKRVVQEIPGIPIFDLVAQLSTSKEKMMMRR